MWAVAEITSADDSGTSFRAPAILEDTSKSGACVPINRPLAVGSRITVKWHREQFPAITRNCRGDGRDFLLGVLGEPETVSSRPVLRARKSPKQHPTRLEPIPQCGRHAADTRALLSPCHERTSRCYRYDRTKWRQREAFAATSSRASFFSTCRLLRPGPAPWSSPLFHWHRRLSLPRRQHLPGLSHRCKSSSRTS